MSQHLELMTATLSLSSASSRFYFQNTYDGKGTFWELLKDIKVNKCHVHKIFIYRQFFNTIFSPISGDKKANACEAPFH